MNRKQLNPNQANATIQTKTTPKQNMFSNEKRKNLNELYTTKLKSRVSKHYHHVSKPMVLIPGYTETYLTMREMWRSFMNDNSRTIYTRLRDEFIVATDMPEHLLYPLVDYAIYRYFLCRPELRPPVSDDDLESCVHIVEKNKTLINYELEKDYMKRRAKSLNATIRSLSMSTDKAIYVAAYHIADYLV